MKDINRANRIGNENEGILIKDIINHSDTTATVILRKKYVQFDKNDIVKYKEKMQHLISVGILDEDCEYEANIWYGLDDTWNKYFDFRDLEYNKDLYDSLKCYVITELYDRKIGIRSVANRLSEIKKTIKMTKSYDREYMYEFLKYIESKSENRWANPNFKFGNITFLYFNPMNDYKEYLVELSYIKVSHTVGDDVRVLPPYKSIVWFDYILHDFMNTADLTMIKKYYPIFLWWRITTVIPIRPNEFTKFERECCTFNNVENTYNIKIPRTKLPPNPLSKMRVIPIISELKTNEEMYKIIDNYIKLMAIENEKYLITLRAYSDTFHQYEHMYDAHIVKDRITYSNFLRMIESFYEEIVSGKYGYNLVENREEITEENEHNTLIKLKLGDTRHLAFCSMMLQGFNPLTIAQIGGHETLIAQNQYIGHLDEFIDAHSLMLAKSIKSNINRNKDNLNDLFTSEDKRRLTFKQFDNVEPRSIDEGLCYSRNFPQDCADKDCLFCDFFQFEFDKLNEVTYAELSDNLSIIKSEIKIKIDFLKRYYVNITKDGSIDLINLKCNDNAQQELIKQSKSLNILVNKKATLLAYMEKTKELK